MILDSSSAALARRPAVLVAAALTVFGVVIAVLVLWRTTDSFDVGDTRVVTVVVDHCWRPEVTIDGRLWRAPSSDPAPVVWGQGPKSGTMKRVDVDVAEFAGADGKVVRLIGSEFHDLACPTNGRPEQRTS